MFLEMVNIYGRLWSRSVIIPLYIYKVTKSIGFGASLQLGLPRFACFGFKKLDSYNIYKSRWYEYILYKLWYVFHILYDFKHFYLLLQYLFRNLNLSFYQTSDKMILLDEFKHIIERRTSIFVVVGNNLELAHYLIIYVLYWEL